MEFNLKTFSVMSVMVLCSVGVVIADHVKPIEGRIPTEWLGPQPLDPTKAGIGRKIADIKLGRVFGGDVSLHEIQGDRGTVVAVRDPDCPVSKAYGPRLAKMAIEYESKGFNFVVLYLNELLGRSALGSDAGSFAGPAVFIAKGGFTLAEMLGVESTGDVFILDAQHRIQFRGAVDDQYGLGYTKPIVTRHLLRNALDAMVSGQSVPVAATTAPGCYIDADPGKDQQLERWTNDRSA